MSLIQSILRFLISLPLVGRLFELARMIQDREVGWQTIVRKTGQFKREQQHLTRKLRLLIIFNPVTEWLDTTKLYRKYLHAKSVRSERKEESPESKARIKKFVDFYGINMNDFEPSDINKYPSFQEFFIRKHTPESRPISDPDNLAIAVCPSDCRITVYESVDPCKRLWIKGHGFTINNLLQDKEKAQIWRDGAIACFRLSPQDYHRYHSPVDGTTSWFKQLGGEYYGVDPLATSSSLDVLAMNDRCCVEITTEKFGKVMFVAIGAEDVGKIKIDEKFKSSGHRVRKGDEIGLFEFGASSIIVLFEKGRIKWDQDLVNWSKQRIMVDVEVGMRIGEATKF